MEVDDFSGKGKPVFAPAGEKPAKIIPFCIVIAAKQDVSVKSFVWCVFQKKDTLFTVPVMVVKNFL
jgi:hypothetical protein